jgi:dipeptidyl aminopeptidase/acylaminoacyl peptidase
MRPLAFLAIVFPLHVLAAPAVSELTNYAKYDAVKISPDGTYLALTQRTSEHESITVVRFRDLQPMTRTHFGRDLEVDSFAWANDTRLLIQPARRFPGYTDFKAPTGEIYGMNVDGKKQEMLFGYLAGESQTGTRIAGRKSIYSAAELVDMTPEDPDSVVIETQGYGIEGELNRAYRMNVYTGRLTTLSFSPLRNGAFLTDRQHRIALVHGFDHQGAHQVHYRKDGGDWQLRVSSDQSGGSLWPVAASSTKGEYFVLDDQDASTKGVYAWQPESGEKRLLFRHPEVDIADVAVDPSGIPWAFKYFDHFADYWYPDPQHPLAQIHKALRSTFRDSDVELTSSTKDFAYVVAHVSGPTNPGMFYVVDARKKSIVHDLPAYPHLKRADLAETEPVEITARDGLKVRGYLTVPAKSGGKRLPLIAMIHGGPHGVFDIRQFDYEVQLFASRGYAVLQVNYRGSGGRGRKYEAAGYGRWGKEMQDDITDAIRWAIADGVADSSRVCIFGASYGAYAALTGAFREPDLFRCAVGMAGVYDLPLMYERGDVQTIRRGVEYLKMVLGTDMEELKRRSPVYNAEKIRASVMLIHGSLDARAPMEHAKRMREALAKAGREVEWITERGEAHGFFEERNRVDTYERILAFFARHLGPEASATAQASSAVN